MDREPELNVEERANELLKRSERLLTEAGGMTPRVRAKAPYSIQAVSCNSKLAPQNRALVGDRVRNEPKGPFCSSTYASILATCPGSCPFRGNGCYAQAGMAVQKLDRKARMEGWSGADTIRAEAAGLDKLFVKGVPQDGAQGGRDLRLHVAGDVPNGQAARELAAAVDRWKGRGGGDAWTYTHRWKRVAPEDWGPIAALASVETTQGIFHALDRGYVPALTVQEHVTPRARKLGKVTVIPCPAQTRGRTCVECRLCWSPAVKRRPTAISFAIHGNEADLARRQLQVLEKRHPRLRLVKPQS